MNGKIAPRDLDDIATVLRLAMESERASDPLYLFVESAFWRGYTGAITVIEGWATAMRESQPMASKIQRFEYGVGIGIHQQDPPFYALLAALMMAADSVNARNLAAMYPAEWEYVQTVWNGGRVDD